MTNFPGFKPLTTSLTPKSERTAVKPFRREERERILGYLGQTYGWTCHYCSRNLASYKQQAGWAEYWRDDMGVTHSRCELPLGFGMPTIDHKVPTSGGGSHHIDNLVMCCYPCNSQKCHLFSYEQFLVKKRGER